MTTIGLYGSVVVEIIRLTNEDLEVPSPYYIIFVLRVVTLVSAVKLFSPLKISSNALQNLITKFRLKHLANVTVFYFAVLYIFALVGVHQIGVQEYRCISNEVMSNDTLNLCWVDKFDDKFDNKDEEKCSKCYNDPVNDNNCVSLASLSVPDIHCSPCQNNDSDECDIDSMFKCPNGYSCRKVNIGRNFGYYGHYDNLGMS